MNQYDEKIMYGKLIATVGTNFDMEDLYLQHRQKRIMVAIPQRLCDESTVEVTIQNETLDETPLGVIESLARLYRDYTTFAQKGYKGRFRHTGSLGGCFMRDDSGDIFAFDYQFNIPVRTEQDIEKIVQDFN